MGSTLLQRMTVAVDAIDVTAPIGRVDQVAGGILRVTGLVAHAGLGRRVVLPSTGQLAEVVRLDPTHLYLLADGPTTGVAIGTSVRLLPPPNFAPDDSWIGRAIDPDGNPIDGKPLLPGLAPRPINAAPPSPHLRRPMGARIETGLAVFNTLLPLVQGQRIGLFAGSGVGKTTLLGDLAKGSDADLIVIALVGERGREVRHFIEDILGPEGMKRAIVVAATSDRAPQIRRQCAASAMTIAEYFRDQGRHVMLFVDSVTRFCEAHREVASAGGEPASVRGFPASTAAAIAQLCERAGPGVPGTGDITGIFSVLVAASDMDEPVADMLRGVLDGHVVLDRAIAERGRFPAVDVLRSVSRSLPAAASTTENVTINQARGLLGRYAAAEMMIQASLYTAGSDPQIDAAIACHLPLDRFLSVKDARGTAAHFAVLRQALAVAQRTPDDSK